MLKANRPYPSLAMLLLASAAIFAGSASARAETSATGTRPAVERAAQKPIDRAEARLEEMRARLKITPAQDPQWQEFVKAERDGAKEMSELIEKRNQSSKAMNAVDDFKNYAAIAEAHEDSLKKVVPAFEKLYASLTDEQKKLADAMFKDTGAGNGRKAS
ncbi:MAG: hypothetical protein JWM91_1359 [Rhodospirillales bacterium]|nr:hypothetical protein [Rhodospirillales bacterium]